MKPSLSSVAFLLLCLVPCQSTLCADMPLRSYVYQENFEKQDPFQYWTSNGTYTVHFKGLSSARSSSGAKSFKLDVSLGTATYLYWKIPVRVPSAGQLQFTGDLYVERADGAYAALGTNVDLSPAPCSGVNVLKTVGSPTTHWLAQTSDLVFAGNEMAKTQTARYFGGATSADMGIWTDLIGLYIFAPNGGRITLYVDNIRIHGVVPEEVQYKNSTTTAWKRYLTRTKKEVYTIADNIIGHANIRSNTSDYYFHQNAYSRAVAIKKAVQQRGYPTSDEYAELKSLTQSAGYMTFLRENPEIVLVTFPYRPIASFTNSPRILPHSPPTFAKPGNSITIKACRGEYKPASFIVRAVRSVSGIHITATDLIGPNQKRIPVSSLDIKLVKCWYQAGDEKIHMTNKRILLPELLLNDDSLVWVDYRQQRNYLKVTIEDKEQYIGISLPTETVPDNAVIKDASTLQPFDLDAETNKQIWVTVNVPEDTIAGDYLGVIRIKAAGLSPVDMNLTVSVLPFDLEPPFLEYALYYRGKLVATPPTGVDSESKTKEQYLVELFNMKNHGVLYPTLYQGMNRLLGMELSLRDQAGLPKDKIYSLGICTGNPTKADDLNNLRRDVETWLRYVSRYGYGTLYVYGIDEASGERLKSERAAWQKVREAGAKVFVACNEGAADIIGDLLDAPILLGPYKPAEVAKYHSLGKKVFSYGNPQVGIEDPEIYRKNYGLGLACAGYDGAMTYAYQHSLGHIWNDFDHPNFRDHVFAYPTSNGVIDTIHWEGFRSAVDDIRYLSTLISLNNRASVLSWLCPMLESQMSMFHLRLQIINRIQAESIHRTPVYSHQ